MPDQPEYLGDGVYVTTSGRAVRLFCFDGVEVYQDIYLEPEVLAALLLYIERTKQ
jgi:hypothetical protein